jgi:peroxiredoxin
VSEVAILEVGEVVPDVRLLDHLGRDWRFSEHRGQPLLLILHRHLA